VSNSGKLKEKIDTFHAKCCTAGLKVTPQRLEVYKTLIEMNARPSAEMVFQKAKEVFPNISLDAVNRMLLT
jgi:Fe2+ or Zn2+ uptake regulation protein